MDHSSFIIIDDSELDRFIVHKLINHLGTPGSIEIFNNAKSALDEIPNHAAPRRDLIVVFLDVQMPVMTGFEFVTAFEKLPPEIRNSYYIVALSSSMNKKEMSKMRGYKVVKEVIEKPITLEKLIPVLDKAKPGYVTNRTLG